MSEDIERRTPPWLRVVRGNPDDIEIAALTTVIASLTGPAEEKRASRSLWADHAALLRRPLCPGAGAWRASVLPR